MIAKKKLFTFLENELTNRKKNHQYRTLKTISANAIDFASNDYLGLNFNGIIKNFLENIIKEIHKFEELTIGSTGSRLISGHREIFEKVENQFSQYAHIKDALLFHSGYVANVSTIFSLLTPRDYAFVDRFCHASILDGIRISGAKKIYFRHNDLNHLEECIKKTKRQERSHFWIFTESVFSMDGDIPPIKEMIQIAKQYECNIFIDEAHSIGVLGNRGKGIVCSEYLQEEVTIISYPMGKAPGLMGCFIGGESIIKDYLINFGRGFIYSTAQPALMGHLLSKIIAYLNSEEAEKRRNHIIFLSQYAREKLIENNFNIGNSTTHIIPIIFEKEDVLMKIVKEIQTRNFLVVGIRPPSVPQNTSRIRLNIHAHNKKEEIDFFINELVMLRNKFF